MPGRRYPAAVPTTAGDSRIPGTRLLGRPVLRDPRGSFAKVLAEEDEVAPFTAGEVFWSRSVRGTVRGLHVQGPPAEASKVVFVVSGEVRDFVVDLRIGSPAFGHVAEWRLAPDAGALFVPAGCAHGFEVVSEDAVMVYLQSEPHDPACDLGIDARSVGIEFRAQDPVMSPRDRSLPALEAFDSPFRFA